METKITFEEQCGALLLLSILTIFYHLDFIENTSNETAIESISSALIENISIATGGVTWNYLKNIL